MQGDGAAARAETQARPVKGQASDTPSGYGIPSLSDPELRAAEAKAIERALGLIKARFESGRVPDHMNYHNSAHTRGVIDRARAIGAAIGMDDRQLLLTVIAAAYHDSVQTWHSVEKEGGVVMRQRNPGRDEVASGHEAVQSMADLGPRFTPVENGIVASAIIGTIPGWDGDASTVCQPFLIDHPVVTTVALADLGAAGMDPDMYLRDGPALFAEENLDVMQALARARRAADIPAARRRFYRSRYLSWLQIQPSFALGRQKRLLEGELNGLDDQVRGRVLGLFCRFEETVASAEDAAATAETLEFVPLMRQLDPGAFPDED